MKTKKIILLVIIFFVILIIAAFVYSGLNFLGRLPGIGIQPDSTFQDPTEYNPQKGIEADKLEMSPQELAFYEQKEIKINLEKANVAVLEFAVDDPARINGGNVSLEEVVYKFYNSHLDDFDMLITMGFENESDNLITNGVSNGNIHLGGASNIGKINKCSTLNNPTCDGFPSNLKYMQQCSYSPSGYDDNMARACVHETFHYWGNGWHTSDNDDCFEPWVSQMLENGHWTQLFSAGPVPSIHTYHVNMLESREDPPTAELVNVWRFGVWTDNNDGTFTHYGPTPPYDIGFNYVDLYQMGLLSEAELSQKEMFVVLNPEIIEHNYETQEHLYSGTRRDVTFNEIKNLLLQREQCENTGPNYYYTGDGSRVPEILPELALDFRVAFAIIKYPDQQITREDAKRICEIVNYNIPDHWYNASRTNISRHSFLRSKINTHYSDNTRNPDCESLFQSDTKMERADWSNENIDEFIEYDLQKHMDII